MTNAQTKLKQALLILLDDHDFDQLSISRICQKAGVNRSTFYAHYDNQYDLLFETQDYVLAIFEESFQQSGETIKDNEKAYDSLLDRSYLLPYLTFIRNHQKLYRIFLKNPQNLHRTEQKDRILEQVFRHQFDKYNISSSKRRELMVTFIIGGIRALIEAWVLADCQDSIDDIINTIHLILFKGPPDESNAPRLLKKESY